MSFGERLRMARSMKGFTQAELGEEVGAKVGTVSRWELGKEMPDETLITPLAQHLGVTIDFFYRADPVEIRQHYPTGLNKREEQRLIALTQEWLERYLYVERFVAEELQRVFRMPQEFPMAVANVEQVEIAAMRLRKAWKLGRDPIASMTEVLEDRGIKVGLVEGCRDFEALALWTSTTPVVVTRSDLQGEYQRFALARELGRLFLVLAKDMPERATVGRFAAAFLMPREAIYSDLGRERKNLKLFELVNLKRKYGVNVIALLMRAQELEIISETRYNEMEREFQVQDWWSREPGENMRPERPERMHRLVLYALAENRIPKNKAEEVLGRSVKSFIIGEISRHGEMLSVYVVDPTVGQIVYMDETPPAE